MSDQRGTLQILIGELSDLLSPIVNITPGSAPAFLGELGLTLSRDQANQIAPALAVTTAAASELLGLVFALEDALDANDAARVIATSASAADQIAKLISSLDQFKGAIASLGLPNTGAIVGDIPSRLFNYLLALYLAQSRGTNQILELAGVLERTDFNVGSVDPTQPFYTKNDFHFGRIAGWFSDPSTQLKQLYDWDGPGFDGTKILAVLNRAASELGLPALYQPTAVPPKLDLVFVELFSRNDVNPAGIELRLKQPLNKGFNSIAHQSWTLTFGVDADIPTDTAIVFQPSKITVEGATPLTGKASADYSDERDPTSPLALLSIAEIGSLSVQRIATAAALKFQWTGTNADATVSIGGHFSGGKFFVDASSGDGFLTKILSGAHIDGNFELGFEYSKTGLHFDGSSALEVQLPLHISLGPVDVEALTLSVGIESGTFPVVVSTNLKGSLGPLTAVIEEMGFKVAIAFADNNGGNLGPVDLQPGFKPPKGVGLSIDAGIVSGGGFLSIDTARGQYAGVLQLTIAGFLNVTAIGLIETKLPDGSNGFSLLIIITADFGAGIQLGFGFTLLAVGGLVGLNRSMLFQPIMDGVRTNAIASVMFPQNVIANAPRIISDLQAFFPPQQGTFLIAPMVRLGYGDPTLVSLPLGVIIEIPPGDIAILGILKLALPAEELAILVLQVNFTGAIEVDKQRIYFFDSLFDSHLLFITINGEMGLLFAYGADANFVVSVGGFHPQFHPPALPFPTPRRISINLINESYARIHSDGYFAVTTNTVQFGTHSDYFFGFSALSVEGDSGFDALIQFSPFHFIVDISTSFSVHVFGVGVYGVGISLTLEGPTPWHANGTASLSFLFFSVDIGIEFTWGDSRDTTLPPVAVMPILATEFGKQSNWRAILPPGSNLLVSLRKLDPSEADLVLHPVGMLQISQRLVPLDLALDKFGNQKPTDANRFALSVTSAGFTKTRNLTEPFAPAQFKNIDDAGKLSQAAYVPQDSGIELAVGGTTYASATAITRIVRYDRTIIDTRLRFSFLKLFVFAGGLFQHLLRGASVAHSPLSAYRKAQVKPYADAVTVSPETFAVALKSNNTAFRSDAAAFTSQAAASDYVARTVAADPSLAGTLHVLPQFEMAA